MLQCHFENIESLLAEILFVIDLLRNEDPLEVKNLAFFG
jgi:hypothetical protein